MGSLNWQEGILFFLVLERCKVGPRVFFFQTYVLVFRPTHTEIYTCTGLSLD